MITQAKKSIDQDYQILTKKSIYKKKQKNQYTKEDKFQEKYTQQKEQNILKLVNFLEVRLYKSLKLDNIFRLKSNVQIPRNADNQYQIGQLNNDFYCYNYKINRIDKNGSMITVTFDPIQRCFSPVENVIQILGRGNEQLKESLEKLHYKKLDSSQYLMIKEHDLFNFENTIDKPCTGYISKVVGDQVMTQYRFMNELYLNLMGINSEMLIHHAMETGNIPIPLYFSEDNCGEQYLSNFFTLNTFNQSINQLQACNYNGQKFPAKITFHNYYYYNQTEQCFYEYLFFIWDIDKQWMSKQRVQENYLDYFNLKNDPASLTQIYYNSEQRCGYRDI
ncbi:unnamed protein product (macronuclear) [Paramecium tetraurelia]|uniref:Uncharacterized protein n=1 Tax=Paramecium tetraurelia TaxID=5888 RepID=A0EHS7_PARTE|nr:uncharacterized protein GSPATT00027194001 [Paramecium tetraurelia]CAK94868.1 unnamed protein product [Paramecium tetraurelia]|eukprot:XP_001462241.1 hypothetical protein (macronuclear) [Paramecium tetraurelia strain d4-2]